jgi:hypothetical protein
MLFQAEAELRWLDHCEASLVRAAPAAPAAPASASLDLSAEATR